MLLPVSIGVLAAYFVANRFAKPVYDCLVTANAFPQLPKVSYRLGRECAEVASQPATPNSVLFGLDKSGLRKHAPETQEQCCFLSSKTSKT